MRRMHVFFALTLAAMLILGACNLNIAPPPATEAPVEPSQPVVATEPPVLTEVPVEPVASPTIVPVDLSGPPMEVGSKFTYIDGNVIVAVPAGQFVMGYGGDDNPVHTVNVSDFWVYRAKVTNVQFALCVNSGQCSPPDPNDNPGYSDPLQANNPVVGVTYDQAANYCAFVNGRLPTEAEWEKTARGPNGNIYPWGDATPNCDLANVANCVRKTTSVREYPQGQSYYEALDMSGNTYEWVADWYSPTYYGESPTDDPIGPDTGKKRSVRSTAYDFPAYESESARRFSNNPDDAKSNLGFRCVVQDPTYFAPYCETVVTYGQDAFTGVPVGGSPASETCPTIDITQNMYCQGNTPVTNIVFTGLPSATIDSDGCAPTGDPAKFVCQNPGTISIKADCQLTLPGDPSCPPGYTQNGNTCQAAGSPGACLPGYNYDPVNQCCTAQAGQGATVNLPVCPVGTYYVDTAKACLPYPAKGIVSITESIGFAGCVARPKLGPMACPSPPANQCPYYEPTWDPVSCSCVCNDPYGCLG
ncbi:MAG: SUMF1/EgtB/PvdO family nonheme iron enzyme [Anaerolineales bacterium]